MVKFRNLRENPEKGLNSVGLSQHQITFSELKTPIQGGQIRVKEWLMAKGMSYDGLV